MAWTDEQRTLALIVTLSLGLCTLFLVASDFVLGSLFEFLGLATIVLGWFVLAPAYYVLTRPTADTDGAADDRDPDAADPLETLQRRYAAGELSETEFERKTERLLETGARAAGDGRDAVARNDPGGDLGEDVDRDLGDELDRDLESE